MLRTSLVKRLVPLDLVLFILCQTWWMFTACTLWLDSVMLNNNVSYFSESWFSLVAIFRMHHASFFRPRSRRCVSHERLFLKPCWASWRTSLMSRWRITCEPMMCSITFEAIDVNERVRWLLAAEWSPFSKMGTTFAFSHNSGNVACCRDAL